VLYCYINTGKKKTNRSLCYGYRNQKQFSTAVKLRLTEKMLNVANTAIREVLLIMRCSALSDDLAVIIRQCL